MSRIVADGSLELQDLSNGYWFEIVEGGLDAVAVPRGSNVTIPGKDGQTVMPKVLDMMPVRLHGTVWGTGSTPKNDYLANMEALRAIFDPVGGTFTLVVHPDATGVGGRVEAGETATITVEFQRLVGPPAQGDQVRTFDLECVCYSDPPGWVIGT